MISNATILWIAAPGKNDVQSMWQHAHISMAVSGMLSSSTRPSSTELRQLRTLEASARAPHTTNHPIPIPAMLSTAAYSYSNLLLLPPSQRDIPPTKPQSKPPYRVISDRWETVRLIRKLDHQQASKKPINGLCQRIVSHSPMPLPCEPSPQLGTSGQLAPNPSFCALTTANSSNSMSRPALHTCPTLLPKHSLGIRQIHGIHRTKQSQRFHRFRESLPTGQRWTVSINSSTETVPQRDSHLEVQSRPHQHLGKIWCWPCPSK